MDPRHEYQSGPPRKTLALVSRIHLIRSWKLSVFDSIPYTQQNSQIHTSFNSVSLSIVQVEGKGDLTRGILVPGTEQDLTSVGTRDYISKGLKEPSVKVITELKKSTTGI